MKHVDPEALVQKATNIMTKQQKLLHWTGIIRAHGLSLLIFHRLEFATDDQLRAIPLTYAYTTRDGTDWLGRWKTRTVTAHSAFSLATADKTFQEAGLKADANLLDVIGFMELTREQVHEFSCDCGGAITTDEMASRIERMV